MHLNNTVFKSAACLLLAIFFGDISSADLSGIAAPATPDTPILPYSNTPFSCIMHVHTRMSSGNYQLPELTQIARAQGVDAIFLSDNLVESIEFGPPPLRHIFWAGYQEKPSVLAIGWTRCLDEIKKENERQPRDARGQPEVLYIPGVEVSPRFFWSGSLLKTNLVCHNHQRNLIIIGTENAPALVSLPTTSGYRWGRHTAWIILTRALLILFIAACLGMLFLPRVLARRSNPGYYPGLSSGTPLGCYTPGEIRRAFVFGLILPLAMLMFLVNFLIGLMPAFKIYSPDDPERFEQRTLDALKRENLMSFWAHPEAPDHSEFKYFGVPFAVDTRPYPEVLLKTKGYTGFAGINEGENKFVDPGSVWDLVLKQYLGGKREEPPWCFGEMLYHYEGQAGKKLSNVETIVWAPEKTAAALLDSIRKGHFYARQNYAGQFLSLDQWRVNGLESGQTGQTTRGQVDLSLRISAKIPGEKAEVLIIRNGAVIKKDNLTLPLELNFQDSLMDRNFNAAAGPEALALPSAEHRKGRAAASPPRRPDLPPAQPTAYYRAVISGKYPVRLVTNPVFISLLTTP